eukprot:330393-Amorphochlora_amoeboformis.AAC.1
MVSRCHNHSHPHATRELEARCHLSCKHSDRTRELETRYDVVMQAFTSKSEPEITMSRCHANIHIQQETWKPRCHAVMSRCHASIYMDKRAGNHDVMIP